MMHKKNSNRWLMTKGVILPILMAMAVVAFAKPKAEAVPPISGEETTLSLDYNDIIATAPVNDDKDKIYDTVEVMPEFPGGVEAMYKWLAEHLKYPAEAAKKKVQGRVFVQFVVEKDGTITQAEVKRSPDDLLSEEALRVVKLMPKWTPGKVGGKPVRTVFNLPISFRLPGK